MAAGITKGVAGATHAASGIAVAARGPVAGEVIKAIGTGLATTADMLQLIAGGWQHMRRVKSVSVSVPCVTGPYVSVNCKLTMLRNNLRISTSTSGGYAATDADLDTGQRIWRRYGATESIVTSNGHDDSGLFETQLAR